jgi:hypothetical protein
MPSLVNVSLSPLQGVIFLSLHATDSDYIGIVVAVPLWLTASPLDYTFLHGIASSFNWITAQDLQDFGPVLYFSFSSSSLTWGLTKKQGHDFL